MANTLQNCVICFSSVKVNSSSNDEASDSICLLSGPENYEQNVILFILREILEISQSELEIYLQTWGNPGVSLNLCERCREEVTSVRNIFLKLCEIRKEYERNKGVLQERIRSSEEEKQKISGRKVEVDVIFYECRQSFCKNFESKTKMSPFDGDRKAKVTMEIQDSDLVQDNAESDDLMEVDDFNHDDSLIDGSNEASFESGNEYSNIIDDKPSSVVPSEEKSSGSTSCIRHVCGGHFDSEVNLENHVESVHEKAPVEQKHDSSEKSISEQRELPDEMKIVRCSWGSCKRMYRGVHNLQKHVREFHENTRYQQQTCSVCGKTLCDNRNLKRHMASVHGIGEREASKSAMCDLCGKSFSDSKSLQKHVKFLHENSNEHQCKLCGKCLQTSSAVLIHKAGVHKIGDFKCDREACSKVFHSKKYLEDHVKYQHEGFECPKKKKKIQNLFCQFCGKCYPTVTHLKFHEEAAHLNKETKPFKCPVPECGKAFAAMKYCKKHLESYHAIYDNDGQSIHIQSGGDVESSCECEKCGMTLGNKPLLRRHSKYCGNEKYPVTCDLCGKGFRGQSILLRHKAEAHGLGDYRCEVEGCSKVFWSKKLFDVHNKFTHVLCKDREIHKCQFCGKGFRRRNQKENHEQNYHIKKDVTS